MVKVIKDTSEETRAKEIARMREKMLHDEASALANAKAEGVEEGRAELLVEIIEQMRRNGLTEEQIKNIVNS